MSASPRLAPLLLAVALAACSRRAPPSFAEALVAAAPEPAPNTYPSAELAVTRFFEAVNAGDVDGALRCFPVRAYHAAYDVDTHFALTGSWDLRGRRVPVPPGVDELGRGLLSVLEFAEPYSHYRRMAWFASSAAPTDLTVTSGDADWRARLDAVKALRVTRAFAVRVVETRDVPLDALDLAMKVSARKLLLLELKLGDRTLPPQLAAVGKLGDNWRLIRIVEQ